MLIAFSLGGAISVLALPRLNATYDLANLGLKKKPSTTQETSINQNNDNSNNDSSDTGDKPQDSSTPITSVLPLSAVKDQSIRLAGCSSSRPSHPGLASSSIAQLRKLAEYETLCGSGSITRASFFLGTPTTLDQAVSEASWAATVLKEFSRLGISPVVFFEPASNGNILNLNELANGAYDAVLSAYFESIKSQGVSGEMMGVWVPLPEGNIPVWKNTDPAIFASAVTRIVQLQKTHIPGSKAAVMLESRSYPSGNTWAGGSYKSLLPYVQPIPKGLIDSFGLQGFAWPPTSSGDVPQLDPNLFLRTDLAAEAARSLGVQHVWFNTGTFGLSYVVSRSSPYTLSPQQRQEVLNGILAQANKLRSQGFSLSIHLFNQDKSATAEGIDWSYWDGNTPHSGDAANVLKTFIHDCLAVGIELWVYDY
jgi:hypothetical protein